MSTDGSGFSVYLRNSSVQEWLIRSGFDLIRTIGGLAWPDRRLQSDFLSTSANFRVTEHESEEFINILGPVSALMWAKHTRLHTSSNITKGKI